MGGGAVARVGRAAATGAAALVACLLLSAVAPGAAAPRVELSEPGRHDGDLMFAVHNVRCGWIVSIRLSDGDKTRKQPMTVCKSSGREWRGPRWVARVRAGNADHLAQIAPGFSLWVNDKDAVVRQFRYGIRVQGKIVESGRIRFRVTRTTGADRFEGTERFKSYCLEGERRIYTRNGKRYCHEPGRRRIQSDVLTD